MSLAYLKCFVHMEFSGSDFRAFCRHHHIRWSSRSASVQHSSAAGITGCSTRRQSHCRVLHEQTFFGPPAKGSSGSSGTRNDPWPEAAKALLYRGGQAGLRTVENSRGATGKQKNCNRFRACGKWPPFCSSLTSAMNMFTNHAESFANQSLACCFCVPLCREASRLHVLGIPRIF